MSYNKKALNNNNGADANLLLSSLRSLSSGFQGKQQEVVDLNRQLATTFDAVNVGNGQGLANLLKVAPGAFATVRQTLDVTALGYDYATSTASTVVDVA